MLIIVSVLIGLGVLALIVFLALVWSNFWPDVVGKLMNSDSRLVRVNGRDYYQLNVSYVFQVESKQYESRSIMFLGGGLHKNEMDAFKRLEDINKEPFVVHYCQ